jgi:3-methyladenine DNA glycosylase AlkD
MLDPGKARVSGTSLRRAARDVKRALAGMARPAGDFDSSGYFRSQGDLGFYNTGTGPMRALARSIHLAHCDHWSIDDAMALADALIVDRYLEVKLVGVELVARYRRDFTPRLLPVCKRWLARNRSSNWATTDAICGTLIGPLLVRYPALAVQMRPWSTHKNMWVRRASVVGLIPSARKGVALELLYNNARRLHQDQEDLIQKAVGWALREAGKADMARLERYLRKNGPSIPRTTLRYAIERFPEAQRKTILIVTREAHRPRGGHLQRPRTSSIRNRSVTSTRFSHRHEA